MTLRQPPNWLQNGSYSASSDRMVINSLLATPGCAGAGDFKITSTGTPSMSIVVAAGAAFVRGTITPSVQGVYHCYNDSSMTRSVGTTTGGNARIDLVVLRVYDQEFAGTDNRCDVEIIQGAASNSPAAPAAPSNSIPLATIRVAAGVTSISQTAITDTRSFVSVNASAPVASIAAAGSPARIGTEVYDLSTNGIYAWTGASFKLTNGPWICTSLQRPTNPFQGMEIWELDTLFMKRWTGTYWKFQRFMGGRNDNYSPWGQWSVTASFPSAQSETKVFATAFTENRASPVCSRQGEDWVISETGLYSLQMQHFSNYGASGYQVGRLNITGGRQPLASVATRNPDHIGSGLIDMPSSGVYYLYDQDRISYQGCQFNTAGTNIDVSINVSITLIGA